MLLYKLMMITVYLGPEHMVLKTRFKKDIIGQTDKQKQKDIQTYTLYMQRDKFEYIFALIVH